MPPFRSVLFCAALTSLFMATGAAVADMSLTTQEGVLTPSLAPIVATVAPGVVSISVSSQQSVDNPVFTDPFFRQFFDFLPEGIPRDLFVQASGSGVVVDATEGLILTNAHLLENAETITVRLADGREYPAEIRGVDQDTDVAALIIKASNLTALTIGHSGDLRVGDYVLAVGNPFGLEGTVTLGIVSALGRSGLGIEGYENFIQVDAAINPGNSGGGLVNLRGELVGINTAIAGPTGGNVGIGFAIPIDMAMQVASQLVADGRVDHRQLTERRQFGDHHGRRIRRTAELAQRRVVPCLVEANRRRGQLQGELFGLGEVEVGEEVVLGTNAVPGDTVRPIDRGVDLDPEGPQE